MVAERHYRLADDLTGFMALTGDQQHIPSAQLGDGRANRLTAVADLYCPRSCAQDGRANGGGLFAARIVVGHNDPVGEACCDCSHHRTLASIAIAAATKYNDEAVPRIRAQRLQRLGEGVRLVGVVDKNRRAISLADEVKAALGALAMRKSCERASRRAPCCDSKPRGNERVLHLKRSGKRQAHCVFATGG